MPWLNYMKFCDILFPSLGQNYRSLGRNTPSYATGTTFCRNQVDQRSSLQLAARGPNLAREGHTIGPRSSAKICSNTFKLDSESRNFNDDCTQEIYIYTTNSV